MIKSSLQRINNAAYLAKKTFFGNRIDDREKAFINHNKMVWKDDLPVHEDGEIVVESINMSSSIIAFSYLANLLAKMHKARILAYISGQNNIKTWIENQKVNKIYRSFNVADFIYYTPTLSQLQKVEQLYQTIFPHLKTKKDIEDLRVENIWIGDLLYDSHCMNYQVPTVDLADDRFSVSLKNAIASYIFWRDYLNTHNVQSIVVSHTVYVQSGIITRLAVNRDIPVFQVNATHLHYLTKKNLWAYNEFFYYPEQFRELPEEERQNGLQAARERIQKRFSGEVGVDMHYSKKSAYGKPKRERILKKSNKTKILVATHCFFDNPHPYGVNLFPDFYEWLYFLGEISKVTDYEWYIKTHPDFLPGNIPIIQEFIRRYPQFSQIPSETSHLQLKEEGIDFGLSVYGTIGFEYAALGIPVINASLCNPRIRYNFNIHPQTIEEYKQILLDLPNQKLEIDINEVYEYYFMAFVHNVNNWLFKDYEDFIREIGGYYQQFDSISYEKFLARFSNLRHGQILASLGKFIESGEYNLRRKFLNDSI